MLIRRHGSPIVRWSAALALVAAFAGAASWRADVHAQLPLQPVGSPFEMTGFIQSATLDPGSDPFRGGTITLNNHLVVVPRNTIFQMPATSLTWAELFTHAPAPYGPSQTGLALNDSPKPLTTFEVSVQGNRVEPAGTYIAGLIFLDQLSLMAHPGFINFIDYGTGDMYVGGTLNTPTGTRVRINDPIGRFGRVMSHDPRFTIDEDNPTIKTETGFPMCVPRTNPAAAADPLCPNGNRPIDTTGRPRAIFTMPPATAPTATERANPATRAVPLGGDPWRMAPFMVGDYVTVKGPLVADASGSRYIDAWGIDGSVGIFTTPGTQPAYVAIDVMLMGIGPNNNVNLAQEGARRARVEGFTTDISTTISINAVDVDACTGAENDRLWAVQSVDPGPPNGAVAGRWRFRPGAPLFDLKAFPFLPPTRELHAFSQNQPPVTTLNGLSAGEYTAPNFEFITPENLGIGNHKVPINFESMAFLAQGSGPRDAFMAAPGAASLGRVGQLSPWPGQTPPVIAACPVPPIASAGPDQQVASNTALVILNGSASSDPNPAPPGPFALSFAWTQTAGPAVTINTPNSTLASFKAPVVAAGLPSVRLTFQLAVNNTKFTAIDTVDVVVTSDVTRPVVSTLKVNAIAPTCVLTICGITVPTLPVGATLTLTAAVTDAGGAAGVAGVQSVIFNFNGVTTTATAPTVAGGNTFSVTIPRPAARTLAYPLIVVAVDKSGNLSATVATGTPTSVTSTGVTVR
ncbi:MAG: hypothetical protein JWL71_1676 [Acidobacteria bacterium]|nr:hypothetical protein [Acidobacteriota bacterium]